MQPQCRWYDRPVQVAEFLVSLNLREQGDETWSDVCFDEDEDWEMPSSWTTKVQLGAEQTFRKKKRNELAVSMG